MMAVVFPAPIASRISGHVRSSTYTDRGWANAVDAVKARLKKSKSAVRIAKTSFLELTMASDSRGCVPNDRVQRRATASEAPLLGVRWNPKLCGICLPARQLSVSDPLRLRQFSEIGHWGRKRIERL